MKYAILVPLLLFSMLASGSQFVSPNPFRRDMQTHIPFNVKDLPEHGISLISPSDPSFEELINRLPQGKTGVSGMSEPFSVFVKNTGDKAVIAYTLKWEFAKADGKVINKSMNYATAGALTGQTSARGRYIIAPHSAHFVSLVFDSLTGSIDVGSGRGANVNGVALDSEAANYFGDQARERVHVAKLDRLNKELAQSTSLTVSVDGVFFADGTFVGPNTTGFFEKVKALQSAKHDLLLEIQSGARKGKAESELFNEVEALTKGPKIRLGPRSTIDDYYNYHKRRYAAELLRMRKATGGESAIERMLQSLQQGWPELRRF